MKPRQIPQSQDAEKGVLGSIMLAPGRILDECANNRIGEHHFFTPSHRVIFGKMVEMREHQKPIDLISLTQYIEDRGALENVGGAAAINELFTFVPSASNADYYIQILKEKHICRMAIEAAEKILEVAYDPSAGTDIASIAQEALVKISGLTESKAETKHIRDVILRRLDYYEALMKRKGGLEGISTGITPLDRATRGLRPGNMIVIAAATKGGKTALAINLGLNVAFQSIPIGIFSLEMNEGELADRMISARGMIDLSAAGDEGFPKGVQDRMRKTALSIAEHPVYIRDESVLSPAQFKAAARKMVAQQGVKLLIVDYLQLMQPTDPKEGRERQVADLSRTLKTTAGELGIPIIVLSQLNDNGRSRESRAIEQDANIFAVIEEEQPEKDGPLHHYINLKLTRDCRSGRIPITFHKEFTAFTEKFE